MSADGKKDRLAEQIRHQQKAYEDYSKAARRLQLSQLRARESELMAELENVQAQLAKIPAKPQR